MLLTPLSLSLQINIHKFPFQQNRGQPGRKEGMDDAEVWWCPQSVARKRADGSGLQLDLLI